MPEQLTERQRDILDFISSSIQERGFPPTLREIGEHFGIKSTNGVNDHLKALEKKGYLRREDLKSRAMRPVAVPGQNGQGGQGGGAATGKNGHGTVPLGARLGQDLVEVPIVGRVAAGQPILAVENVEDRVKIDRFLVGRHEDLFGLRIVGESMIDDGIVDGDYVFVKKSSSARKGDIVVAMIEGEATVKRYFPEGDTIRFQPANRSMEPILVRRSDFRSVDILGVVVGVYRRL
jgi:repressor LexA